MPRVPYELFRMIFEHLEHDPSSLCSIAQSSHACCREAQRILFRNVTSLDGNDRHVDFLNTVIDSRFRLALLVHSYRRENHHDYDWDFDEFGELLVVMRKGLEAMRNLKRLYLDLNIRGTDEVAWILQECVFKLEHLDLKGGSECDLEDTLTEILPRQQGLKHLGLWAFEPLSIPHLRPTISFICSGLVSLAADWDTIKVFLAGHTNLTVLTMLGHQDDLARNINTNIPIVNFKHIKALSYELAYLPNRTAHLDFILQHLPSLTALELEIFDEEEDLRFLQRLPELRTLIIPRPYKQEETIICRIFDNSSKNLQFIHLKPHYTSKETDYLRYTQLQDGVQIVSTDEARKWWLRQE